jgi:hypothetical protein
MACYLAKHKDNFTFAVLYTQLQGSVFFVDQPVQLLWIFFACITSVPLKFVGISSEHPNTS